MSDSANDTMTGGLSMEPKHDRTAFFYGTLMVRRILYRVCHHVERPAPELISHFRFTPALLHDYSRRKVRHADYPAIKVQPSHSVLGTLVSGLSDRDVARLDMFEGGMYERVVVEVEALKGEVFDRDGSINEEKMEEAKATKAEDRKMVKTETYVWCIDENLLEDEEWSFADFRREKIRDWVYESNMDSEVEDENEDEEAEKRRIASVVAGIAAEEEHAGDFEALRSAI